MTDRRTGSALVSVDLLPLAPTQRRTGSVGVSVDLGASSVPTTAVRWSGSAFEMGTSSPVVRWAGSAFNTSGSAPIVIWNINHFELAP